VRVLWLLIAVLAAGCAAGVPVRSWREVADDCYADVRAGRLVYYQAPYHHSRGGLVGRVACDQFVEEMQTDERRRAAASPPRPVAALEPENRGPALEQRLEQLETDLGHEKERLTETRSLAERAVALAEQAVASRTEGPSKRRPTGTVVVNFGFDRWELDATARATLAGVVKQLKETADLVVDLEGHTDSVGTERYNLELSQRRAEAVRRFLVEQGIELHRIHFIAFGEAHPVADNKTPVGRAQNRRSVVKLFTLAP
jgi:outer membrane protein OmpA-like peptidoglycan-associated protein